MTVNKIFITLFITSFIFWNAFNYSFTPLSLYFSLIIFMLNFKFLSLGVILWPVQALFLFHSLLVTPILVILNGYNINLNHLFAEIYIFAFLVGASYLSYKHIRDNNYTIIFTYVYIIFALSVFVEWYFGAHGVFLNDLLGFKTNSPAGAGIYYRAFGFFPEPSDLAVANLFFFILFSYHNTSYFRGYLMILIFILITLITRSATLFLLIGILGSITLGSVTFKKSTFKTFFKYYLPVIVGVFLLFKVPFVTEITHTVINKVSFNEIDGSARSRAEMYLFYSQLFLNGNFTELLLGRGTGFMSVNYDNSVVSWILTLFLEKGLVFTFIFFGILCYYIILNLFRYKMLRFENALLLTALLPLFVQTGFYFPFLGFALGVYNYHLRSGY